MDLQVNKDMKQAIYHKLSLFRDNSWVPDWLVDIVDWFRYEVFYTEENL